MKISKTQKVFELLFLIATITAFTVFGYPTTKKALTTYHIEYYSYQPKSPVVSLVDTSKMPPARAVPILMYHGVVKTHDDSNTTIDNFIKQMEMLKREGYQTISIAQYEQFRQGKSALPPKPIILTFDDGRKDSYYPTDDILKKLGFKATLFLASEKTLENEPFYLSWDDMKKMLASGRWEIEAHGRRSHEKVLIDPSADVYGRYLTSRMYLPGQHRQEAEAEYEQRVEQDYVNNLNDLKNNLGVEAKYLAIPLNDYGQTPVSNEPNSAEFNQRIIEKYFQLAFIEANNSNDVLQIRLSLYNYKDDDPYRIRRFETKNIDANTLKDVLAKEAPAPANLTIDLTNPTMFTEKAAVSYGNLAIDKLGLHLNPEENSGTGKVLFGDSHWTNYQAVANLQRISGRSVVLLAYVTDEKNYLSFGLTDGGIFLRETVNGVEKSLAGPIRFTANLGGDPNGNNQFELYLRGQTASCYLNGHPLFLQVPLSLSRGQVGFKVWGDNGRVEGVMNSLSVREL